MNRIKELLEQAINNLTLNENNEPELLLTFPDDRFLTITKVKTNVNNDESYYQIAYYGNGEDDWNGTYASTDGQIDSWTTQPIPTESFLEEPLIELLTNILSIIGQTEIIRTKAFKNDRLFRETIQLVG